MQNFGGTNKEYYGIFYLGLSTTYYSPVTNGAGLVSSVKKKKKNSLNKYKMARKTPRLGDHIGLLFKPIKS